MTSHREAPQISKDPVADNTDLYAFVSPDKPETVTILANYIPLEEPAGGPNFNIFDDEVLYEINVDNDRDGEEDIVYQFRFKTEIVDQTTFLYNKLPISFNSLARQYDNLNVRQSYSLTRLDGKNASLLSSGLITPPVNIGPESTPNYGSLVDPAIHDLPSGETVFAGQRAEGFYVDLGSIFDLLLLRPFAGAYALPAPPPTPNPTASGGVNATSGYNVHTIGIQIPIDRLVRTMPTGPTDPNAIIGIYASASRQKGTVLEGPGHGSNNPRSLAGPFTQVSRLGMPLINEVLIPLGMKDFWNATDPKDDKQFVGFYRDPEPARLIPNLYPVVHVPSPPREDIVAALLSGFSLEGLGIPFTLATPVMADLLRLNVAQPPTGTASDPHAGNRLGILGRAADNTTPAPDLAGFPNGRRVFDDVVDIEIQALAGATPFTQDLNKPPNSLLGDGVDGPAPDAPFLKQFPYLATPYQGYLHVHTHD